MKNLTFPSIFVVLACSWRVIQVNRLFAGALSTSSLLVLSRSPSTKTRSASGSVLSADMAATQNNDGNSTIGSRISYRSPTPEDIPRCFAIESASYPADEAASLDGLHYRQEQAGEYFQLCILSDTTENDPTDFTAKETIVGFICSTRCNEFTEESMSTNDPAGKLLAIHSVVVEEPYRKQGIAKAMLKRYVEIIKEKQKQSQQQQQQSSPSSSDPIVSMVLLAKAHLLGFYVQCGFQVNRPSPIVHGQELWYELQQDLGGTNVRTLPKSDESWFCKTEQFKRPFPEVKPYLEDHKIWVEKLRKEGHCITSGYRVDAEGKPGGGGLMFLAAKCYPDALKIVEQDPLVANDCVNWELNGWIGQVGDVQMR